MMPDAGAPAGDTAREEAEAVENAIAYASGCGGLTDWQIENVARRAIAALDRVRADNARGEDHEAVVETIAKALSRYDAPEHWDWREYEEPARMVADALSRRPSPVDDTVRLRDILEFFGTRGWMTYNGKFMRPADALRAEFGGSVDAGKPSG